MRFYSQTEKLILRALSEDSRATVTKIAKIAKCSRPTAAKAIDKLVLDLDLRFTIEIDLDKLILERHVIMVKFLKKPSVDNLREIFKNEKNVVSVLMTSGDFDLVILATASTPLEYIYWETIMIEKLSEYGPRFKSSEMPIINFGFIPLSTSQLEKIDDRVGLDKKDKELLMLLNDDSRMSYSDLARAMKMNEDTIRYRLFALKNSGFIRRFTIAAQNPPYSYIFTFFEDFGFGKDFEKHASVARSGYLNSDKEFPVLATFQLATVTTGSYSFFGMTLFNTRKEAMESIVRRHKAIYKEEIFAIKHAKVINLVKGLFPFRNLDIKTGYKTVRWE